MLKVISQLFSKKEEEELVDEEKQSEMKRMNQMRTRITHNKLKALSKEAEGESSQESQNLITRAKNLELAMSDTQTNITLLNTDENKQMAACRKDWQQRISHLPGFEVDPNHL